MTYVYNSQLDAFSLYHISQEETAPVSSIGAVLPALGHATSGAAGTAVSKVITYPLDLVITRLQTQRQIYSGVNDADYKGLLDAIQKIYNGEGGVKAFYSGVVQDTAKSVADSFLFFLAYNYIREKRLKARGSTRALPFLDELGVGMLAGAFSKFWTTPIQNIVTRKQTAAMVSARDPASSVSPDLSTKDIALQIRHEKGLQGFWSGYSASLVLTLNPSITMLLHNFLLRVLVPSTRRDDPGARITFLLAAMSKAVASTLTYPFSLAKTRAQVSSQSPSDPVGPTSEIEKPAESLVKSKALRARQRTVFATILHIARTEGVLSLYQGLGAEVLKGFFSHGMTMLMKDQIHTVIVNLYSLILKALKKYPSPEELADIAAKRTKDAYQSGKEQVGDAYAKGAQLAENATTQGTNQAGDLLEKGRNLANDASSRVQGMFKDGEAGDKGKEKRNF